jgi:pimeloyl-ACP methyl ester carboxylesterase
VTYQFIENQVYVNEHSICYLEGGIASTSAPILFLHGWGVGTKPYQEVLNVLCQRYKVIAPELPGFGKSSGSKLNWNYNEYAKILAAFLKTLNLKKVHVIGHSLGGGIAATIAALMPTLVQSLVLVDSTGIPVEPVPKVFLKRAIEMTAQAPQIKFPQIMQIFQAFSYNFLFRTQNTIQVLLLSLKKDLKPLLPKIESPCLLVWGAKDLTTPLSAAQEFSQCIKGSKLVVVDGVYHEWSIFFVEKITNIIFDFIEEIEAKKSSIPGNL